MKNVTFTGKMRIIAVIVICFCRGTDVSAQEQERYEISVGGGFGLSTLQYKMKTGERKDGTGGTFGVSGSYFFNDGLGIRTGLEMSLYKAESNVASISDRYMAHDGKDEFEFRSVINEYTEKQSLMTLEIPLLLQLQYPLFDEQFIFFSFGGKVAFPMNAYYKTSGSDLVTSAYYPKYDIVLNGPVFQGLGAFRSNKVKEDLDFKPAFMLSGEVGLKWEIAESFSLYSGFYIDYGLNDIRKKVRNQPFLIYNQQNPAHYVNNSVLNTQYTHEGKTDAFTKKIMPMAVGIKIRVAFRIDE